MSRLSSGLGLIWNRCDPIGVARQKTHCRLRKTKGRVGWASCGWRSPSTSTERERWKTKLGTCITNLKKKSTNPNTSRPQIQRTQTKIERDDSKSELAREWNEEIEREHDWKSNFKERIANREVSYQWGRIEDLNWMRWLLRYQERKRDIKWRVWTEETLN